MADTVGIGTGAGVGLLASLRIGGKFDTSLTIRMGGLPSAVQGPCTRLVPDTGADVETGTGAGTGAGAGAGTGTGEGVDTTSGLMYGKIRLGGWAKGVGW